MSELKEYIFAHAVALHQTGRMRSTIHVKDRRVFIVNFDKTVFMSFYLPDREVAFKGEINFEADDYDSEKFREVDGRIVFTQTSGDYIRQKSCATPGLTFAQAEEGWNRLQAMADGAQFKPIFLEKSLLSLIEEGLSHVEIHSDEGRPVIAQRDIFSGTVYRIEKASATQGLMVGGETIPEGIRIGLRTNDFLSLFNFNSQLNFYVSAESPLVVIHGDRREMRVFMASCKYDELGNVEVIEALGGPRGDKPKGETAHGRQKPEVKASEQEADPKDPPRRRRRSAAGDPVDGGKSPGAVITKGTGGLF